MTVRPSSFRSRIWRLTGFSNREDQFAIVLSLLVGGLVGLAVVGFVFLTGRLAEQMYPPGSAAWRRFVIPVAGTLISGVLLARFFPEARGSGIPQTKFALFIQEGYISLRTVVGKFICCSLSLASGLALGREGPSVQIGAGIASVVGRRLGLKKEKVRALVPAGCAAALAAAFNTPIAAVLFSLEEILDDLQTPMLGSVVLSAATSWIVLHLLLGDQPLFHPPAYKLVSPFEFAIYAVLGVAGGLASVAFVKLLLLLRLRFRELPASTTWLQPTAGGLLMGLFALFVPQVLGVGYNYVDQVLSGSFAVKMVVLLAVMKLIATPVCYSSGNAGGIFGPSLFIGAMIGGAVGSAAHALFPQSTATPGAYALVGMGTAFAGIIRTPLTSVIMIFEMTRDYSIIVPLMISNLISFFVSEQLQPQPIYKALALQEGVYLPSGDSREALTGVRVTEVMQNESQPLPAEATIAEAKARFTEEKSTSWPVGTRDALRGVIRSYQIDTAEGDPATIGELLPEDGSYPFVHADHPLSYALELMGQKGLDAVPVVSRANIHQMFGIVTLGAILATYGVKEDIATPALKKDGE